MGVKKEQAKQMMMYGFCVSVTGAALRLGLIDHIQSSWLTNGVGMAQLALQYGSDDFGGTLIGEEVVSCTGARSTELTDKRIIESIKQIGYSAEERDNFYETVSMR